MVEQLPDGHMVLRLGDASGGYQRWRAEVLEIRELPEYKLRKLWKLNFSAADIKSDKHHAVCPPDRAARHRKAIGRKEDTKRGRAVSAKRKAWLYARALRDVAEGLLTFHNLDSAMRAELTKERDSFVELMKKYAHKNPKGS